MNKPLVTYQRVDRIGVIRVDNPPVNALSQQVRAGLLAALERSAVDDSCVVLLLCGGKTFIAGADIKEFGAPPREPHLPDVIAAMENHPKPVVAALHGNALGGGLELAMGAHYRIALRGTRLGLPEVTLGIVPGAGGTQRLPRLVGVETALEMLTGGAPVSAEAAREAGLVDALIDGELETEALGFCQQLLRDKAPVRLTGNLQITDPGESFFEAYRAKTKRKTRGQLAPGYIVDLVETATRTGVAEGMKLERARFLECRESPQSAALRHAFFAEKATTRLPFIPAGTPALPVDSVAVIGAGTMGGGIAMSFANAGIPVILVDAAAEFLNKGVQRIRDNYSTSVTRGRLSQEQSRQCMNRITGTTRFEDIAGADVVIEAVFENMSVKKEVFSQLEKHCKAECILASNTSYLDINQIAASTACPERVVGAHFFSPANVMKLLEVVRTEQASPTAINTFVGLAKRIGKIPVTVGVCHGFVGNRMLKGYVRQAQLLLLEGATPAQVDSVAEDWGMAMGPLAVGDLAGIDISYRSRRDQGIPAHSIAEFDLADTLVEMDRLGQKTGAGYYRYDSATRQREPDEAVHELIGELAAKWNIERRSISDEEIIDRLVLALVNEGAAIVREGIAARPSDVDVVYLNGYGFPRWRGGPMYCAEQSGLDDVLRRLQHLHRTTGDDCWQADALLLDLVQRGESLDSLNRAAP